MVVLMSSYYTLKRKFIVWLHNYLRKSVSIEELSINAGLKFGFGENQVKREIDLLERSGIVTVDDGIVRKCAKK